MSPHPNCPQSHHLSFSRLTEIKEIFKMVHKSRESSLAIKSNQGSVHGTYLHNLTR